jgi:hypothetical protein
LNASAAESASELGEAFFESATTAPRASCTSIRNKGGPAAFDFSFADAAKLPAARLANNTSVPEAALMRNKAVVASPGVLRIMTTHSKIAIDIPQS